jgi:prepilin-type N-terminal cleavage/methylation domain-containing protein
MKCSTPNGFTLIEMITVVGIIVVLASLIIGTAGYVNNKAARDKTLGLIKAYGLALDAYKNDNGNYPNSGDTELLDPRKDWNPTGGTSADRYQKACRDMYKDLSGDREPKGELDGKPEEGNTVYYSFKKDELSFKKDPASGGILKVYYVQDAFGGPFGYSTAGALQEQEYREEVRKNPRAARPSDKELKGYNPTYDLWSTGGGTSQAQTGKWVKNWSN